MKDSSNKPTRHPRQRAMAENHIFKSVLYGGLVEKNLPPTSAGGVIKFNGSVDGSSSGFSIDNDLLEKHILFVGGTGSGKTNLFKHFVSQIKSQMTADDVMIVFDTKGDFFTRFYDSSRDLIIGNSRELRPASQRWNIFREIITDAADDQDVIVNTQEICRTLFADKAERTNNPFFPNAARDLFAAIIITMVRLKQRGDFGKEMLQNAILKNIIDSYSVDDLLELIVLYNDLKSKAEYISGENAQSQGVLSEMYSVINDLFIGVFNDIGDFSVRNFIRKKSGRTLFVEYDLAIGDTLSPIYSLLFDLALKETLSRNSVLAKGNVYLILDELKLLPHLHHLDDGVNFGRSLGLKVIAGIQSIDQLIAVYYSNEAVAHNIVSGFSSTVTFRLNDSKTREYINHLHGKNVIVEQYMGHDGQYKEIRRDGSVVEDWDLMCLKVGEAIVGLAGSAPFRFQFREFM